VRIFVFKPDGIGDFVLATGGLRLLAAEAGEQNLLICVRSVIVPLARSQFPLATVIELPTAPKRKAVNLFVRNFFYCLPLWFNLKSIRVDAAVCFSSIWYYLETFLFYSARANGFAAKTCCFGPKEPRIPRLRRRGFSAPNWSPEEAGEFPLEQAHRRLVARVLNRPLEISEVLPALRPTVEAIDTSWICAPVTEASKVYPFLLWKEVFSALKPESLTRNILLVGSHDQRGALNELKELLKSAEISSAKVHIPGDLVEFLNLIAKAELVLSVDTAAAHFATALDRACVVLFSGCTRECSALDP
jgi:ADP-heptose:LPS heptosyltransferase